MDGLRAVAVLSVVASHSFPRQITIGQSFGVDLFFVISGFCLAYPSLAKLHERGSAEFDVYKYAARRVVRIVPPYYLSIAVILAGMAFSGLVFNRVSALDIARQLFFLDNGTKLLALSFWSLSVEFRWYFVFPIALWLWTKSPRAFIAAAIAIALAASGTMAYSPDLYALPAFLLGIVAADIHVRRHRLASFAAPACAVMLVLAYLRTGTFVSPLWQIAVFLLVVAGGSSAWLGRVLSMKWMTAIGLTSFSIYLMQEPVIAILQKEGIVPWARVIAAIVAGFLFWSVAERPFVETALRTRLIAAFDEVFAKWLPRIDIGRILSLGCASRTVPQQQVPLVPSLRSPDAGHGTVVGLK